MEKTGWKYYLLQTVFWLLFFQMVNISIAPPDLSPNRTLSFSTENTDNEINQIESIYELVSENLLDTDIPESDEPDDVEKTVNSEVLFYNQPDVQSFDVNPLLVKHRTLYRSSFTPLYTDPVSPPPKKA